jgi:hypothetical protein
MTLRGWLENRWIEAHKATRQEVADLLAIVDRDLADAAVSGISSDARGNLAYSAVLQLSVVALHAAGFRPGRTRHHELAMESLQFTVGAKRDLLDVFELARKKRNSASYSRAGGTSAKEADELVQAATALRTSVVSWLKAKHSQLV